MVLSMRCSSALVIHRSGQIAPRFGARLTRGALLGGLVALVAAGCGTAHPATLTACRQGPVFGSMEHPYIGATQMSLAGAMVAVRFPIAEANVAIADPANLKTVWVSEKTHQVALVYGNGDVTVMMTSPAPYRDPRADFSAFIRENHATARISSVNGKVALIISPHSDACHENSAWVEFEREGVDINVVSVNHGTAALLAVAWSLDASS